MLQCKRKWAVMHGDYFVPEEHFKGWKCMLPPARDIDGLRLHVYAAMLHALFWCSIALKSYLHALVPCGYLDTPSERAHALGASLFQPSTEKLLCV
eukprot:scaffold178149_cov22-Tisochrysis_lutea.AAC.1